MARQEPRISTGCTVELLRDDGQRFRFRLVPPVDADIAEGKLSVDAPLGKSLLGRRAGEKVTYEAPAGPVGVRVLKVEPLAA